MRFTLNKFDDWFYGFIVMDNVIEFLKKRFDVARLDNLNSYYNPKFKRDRISEIIKVASRIPLSNLKLYINYFNDGNLIRIF